MAKPAAGKEEVQITVTALMPTGEAVGILPIEANVVTSLEQATNVRDQMINNLNEGRNIIAVFEVDDSDFKERSIFISASVVSLTVDFLKV